MSEEKRNKKKDTNKKEPQIQVPMREEYKVLLEWEAPSRVFKKRDKAFFRKISTIAIALAIILIFLQEFLLIAVILAIIFVTYVLSTVPPEKVTHKITSHGVVFAGHDYNWYEIKNFFFTKNGDIDILNLTLISGLSKRLTLILTQRSPKPEVKKLLSKRIGFIDNPQKDILERAAEKAASKLSLD